VCDIVPRITWLFVVCVSVCRLHHRRHHHRASLCNLPAALTTTQSRFMKCGLTSCPQTDIDDSFTFHQLLCRAVYCQFFTILGVGKLRRVHLNSVQNLQVMHTEFSFLLAQNSDNPSVDQCGWSTLDPVSTGMGDRLWLGKPLQCVR